MSRRHGRAASRRELRRGEFTSATARDRFDSARGPAGQREALAVGKPQRRDDGLSRQGGGAEQDCKERQSDEAEESETGLLLVGMGMDGLGCGRGRGRGRAVILKRTGSPLFLDAVKQMRLEVHRWVPLPSGGVAEYRALHVCTWMGMPATCVSSRVEQTWTFLEGFQGWARGLGLPRRGANWTHPC